MRLPSRARMRPTHTMQSAANLRRTFFGTASVAAMLLVSMPSSGQYPAPGRMQVSPAPQPRTSQLPVNPPTALPQPPTSAYNCQQPPCNASPSEAPAASRPHRATVTFADSQLTVAANDSSLHQILRSISVITGMTINGGVAEQRVFGTYGPADAATILATLLDGTGVNMLLRDGPNHAPAELTLTQRGGGPTPMPITPQDDLDAATAAAASQPALASQPATAPQPVTQPQPSQAGLPPSTSVPSSIPQPANNVLGNPNNRTPSASEIPTTNSVPVDALPTPSTTVQTQQGIVDTPNSPPAGSTAPTADSIYQQLLQLQKAKAAASGTSPAAPSPPQ